MGRGNFCGYPAHWKALWVTAVVYAAKIITAPARLLSPTALLPSGPIKIPLWCGLSSKLFDPLYVCIAADHPEFDAQISAESAACAEAWFQVIYRRCWTAPQDVRLSGDSVYRRHGLPESAGTHLTHLHTYARAEYTWQWHNFFIPIYASGSGRHDVVNFAQYDIMPYNIAVVLLHPMYNVRCHLLQWLRQAVSVM